MSWCFLLLAMTVGILIPSSGSVLGRGATGNRGTRAETEYRTPVFHQLTGLWTCGMRKDFPGELCGNGAPACDLLQNSMARPPLLHTRGDSGHPVNHLHEETMTVIKHHAVSFHFCLVSTQSFTQSLVRSRCSRWCRPGSELVGLYFLDKMGLLWACHYLNFLGYSSVPWYEDENNIRYGVLFYFILFFIEAAWWFSHGTWDFYAVYIFYLGYCPEAAFTIKGQKLASWGNDSSDLFQMFAFKWETLFSRIVYFYLILQKSWKLSKCGVLAIGQLNRTLENTFASYCLLC